MAEENVDPTGSKVQYRSKKTSRQVARDLELINYCVDI